MAIITSRPNGQGPDRFFKYKRINKRQPTTAAGTPNWVVKSEYVETALNNATIRIKSQTTYTCPAANFPNVARTPPKSLTQTVLTRNLNRNNCVMRVRPAAHACDDTCTVENFYTIRDKHEDLELRETENMGIGVFALADIPKDTVIGLYTGELKQQSDMQREEQDYSAHIRTFNGDTNVSASALREGNWTRFVNHSCAPNCRLSTAMNCGTDMVVAYIRTTVDISAEDELFIDYGREYFRETKGKARKGRKQRLFIKGEGCLCGQGGCHSKKRSGFK